MTINVGNREKIIVVDESTRNTIGAFASDGFYIGVEPTMTDFNENPRSMKSRISVNGGMQMETMDEGVDNYQFTLSWKITDWRHLGYFISNNVRTGTSPFVHTLKLDDSETFKFFSLQRIIDNVAHTYLGCGIIKIRYEWKKATGDDEAGYVKAIANVVASSFSNSISIKTVDDSPNKTVYTFNEFKATIGGTEKILINDGSLEIDSGVNPEDFFYCNATNDKTIGEISPIFFKSVGNLTFNVNDDDLIDEMLLNGISGISKFEFIKNAANDKIEFNFSNLFNLQGFAPTNFKSINQAGVVYNATISSIVVTDENQFW